MRFDEKLRSPSHETQESAWGRCDEQLNYTLCRLPREMSRTVPIEPQRGPHDAASLVNQRAQIEVQKCQSKSPGKQGLRARINAERELAIKHPKKVWGEPPPELLSYSVRAASHCFAVFPRRAPHRVFPSQHDLGYSPRSCSCH